MAERGFLTRNRIVRSAIRQDVLFFALPALVLWTLGLVVCNQDGEVDEIWSHLWIRLQRWLRRTRTVRCESVRPRYVSRRHRIRVGIDGHP